MKTGFDEALELGADIVVKIDGDGQMDPALIPRFVEPIVSGEADFTRATGSTISPSSARCRSSAALGNLALSFLVKLASGYWHAFDPCNGYVAVRATRPARHEPRTGWPTAISSRSACSARRTSRRRVLQDIPMQPSTPTRRARSARSGSLGDFAPRLVGRSLYRMFMSYFMRDFNVVSVFLLAGVPPIAFGVAWSAYHWIQSCAHADGGQHRAP